MKKQNIISNSGSPLEAHVASSKIIVSHIDKVYTNGKKSTKAIDDVSIDIQDNDFVCIVGPSGCGKSTLLRMLAGLDFPTKGEIVVNDTPVTGPGPDRGMVFQSYTLFPWMNVEDNIKFGLRIKKLPKDEQQRIADRYLDIIGLRKFAKAYPKELSGGMKQRVAIARALVNDPAIILADEPTGNLDSKSTFEIIDIFQRLNEGGATIVMVTHEPDVAEYTKRIVTFKDGHKISDEIVENPKIAGGEM